MTHLPDRAGAHREAQDLLPWLANGRLDGAELRRVQAHLDTCVTCRADLDALYTLQDVADLPPPDLDVDKAFARLLPQLDAVAPTDAAPVIRGWRTRLAANDGRCCAPPWACSSARSSCWAHCCCARPATCKWP